MFLYIIYILINGTGRFVHRNSIKRSRRYTTTNHDGYNDNFTGDWLSH